MATTTADALLQNSNYIVELLLILAVLSGLSFLKGILTLPKK